MSEIQVGSARIAESEYPAEDEPMRGSSAHVRWLRDRIALADEVEAFATRAICEELRRLGPAWADSRAKYGWYVEKWLLDRADELEAASD